jgi:predicted DNA-binding transcriptional regulator YafY
MSERAIKGKREPRSAARKPTYGAAARLGRLLYGLLSRPRGWSFAAVEAELGISERTLLRYLAACRRELVDGDGRPIIETFRQGNTRLLRLAEAARMDDSTVYQVLVFYFALSVFQFLDGTVIEEGVADLWERFLRSVPGGQRARLADLRRKFYAVPHAVKDYRAFDAQLDEIIFCLVHNRRMRIDYASVSSGDKTHDFEPYTLLMYRGGLYLLGRSARASKIVTLAVERMRRVERLAAEFEYPVSYSPEKHSEGIFGIIEGPETRVELAINDAQTRAYLESRRMHRTQAFHTRRDGRTVLTMTVRGTDELKYWILGFGPHVEVLRPSALRAEVGGLLARAARAYAGGDNAAPRTPRAKPRAAGYGAAAVRTEPRKQGRN